MFHLLLNEVDLWNHNVVCGSDLSGNREVLPGNITPFTLFTLDAPFFLTGEKKQLDD